MPRRTKAKLSGLGKAIESDRKKRVGEEERAVPNPTGVSERHAARSVLEQNSLDDFIASADLARTEFQAVRGQRHEIDDGPRLVSAGPVVSLAEQERAAVARRVQVPIPHRPRWEEGIGADELTVLEGEAFLEWRRGLARMEEEEGLVMTPYERNLDFWRQLWRCVERSDVLVQILDARDPEFYRCLDLERYVESFKSKRHLLLVNKADFLSPELRRRWQTHFTACGVDVVFFSALRELHRQQRLEPALPRPAWTEVAEDLPPGTLPPHGPLASDDRGVIDCAQLLEELQSRLSAATASTTAADNSQKASSSKGVVGFVGYPNVGKSSVINALFGAKKVSMSRTPGKTKHLQTLELPELGLTLCDCPGLVFPSVAASKAHLVINGTVPLVELRDSLSPVRLVVEKVGMSALLEKYNLTTGSLRDAAARCGDEQGVDDARALLAAISVASKHFLRCGVPDDSWAARKVLREYCTGGILHCEPPAVAISRDETGAVSLAAPAPEAAVALPAEVQVRAAEEQREASESDFSDLEDFLNESRGSNSKQMTKRKARQLNKRLLKGGAVAAPTVESRAAAN
mmetsp:Transcript_44086/g.79324  ORF Transcript_44086/g.79324 Transcript_44086/m.79324 type:complete len:575 (-) Transcript_44086:66-1790(-)